MRELTQTPTTQVTAAVVDKMDDCSLFSSGLSSTTRNAMQSILSGSEKMHKLSFEKFIAAAEVVDSFHHRLVLHSSN